MAGDAACRNIGSDNMRHSQRDHKFGRMAVKRSTAGISVGGWEASICGGFEYTSVGMGAEEERSEKEGSYM